MGDLKNVKKGDKLSIYHHGEPIAIREVLDITKAGNIKTKWGIFTVDGRLRGSNVWNRTYAEITTPEKITEFYNRVEKQKLAYFLRNTTWYELDLETLEKVAKLIKERG